MPEPIATLNEESLKTDLRELVRGTVEDTPERPARGGGRRPGRRGALREDRGEGRRTARGTTSASSRRPPAR